MATPTHYSTRGYINTRSSAGSPTPLSFALSEVTSCRVWHNSYGNPSYGIALSTGDYLYLVDDFGLSTSSLPVPTRNVPRRRDLFDGYLPRFS